MQEDDAGGCAAYRHRCSSTAQKSAGGAAKFGAERHPREKRQNSYNNGRVTGLKVQGPSLCDPPLTGTTLGCSMELRHTISSCCRFAKLAAHTGGRVMSGSGFGFSGVLSA